MILKPYSNTVVARAAGVAAPLALALVLGAAQPKQETPAAKAVPAAADSPRHKQLTDDSAQLLALAVALKTEVDKTNKDTLSIAVVRKADEIEKLAHRLREQIRTAGN